MSVYVIDTIKPKNNGTFPIVEAADVKVTASQRLDSALNDKANQSDLNALSNTVSGKASQADLTALSETVSTKASASDLSETNAAVALKADQSALNTTNAAVATKANASDVATTTASLQAQIDAIVTPATQDAEVQNARIDADGKTYGTLKQRLDSENSVLEDVLGISKIEFTYQYYIDLVNLNEDDTVDLTPISSGNFRYAIIECSEGDTFTVNATGGNTSRAWAFIDINDKIIAVQAASTAVENLILVAPHNVKYLVINDKKASSIWAAISYKGNIGKVLNTFADKRYGNSEISFMSGGFIDLRGDTVDIDAVSATSHYRYAVVECEQGDYFTINGTGGATSALLWAFADQSYNILTKAANNEVATNKKLIAPADAKYLIINDNDTGGICLFGSNVYDALKNNSNSVISKYEDQIDSVSRKVIGDKSLTSISIALISDIHGSASFDMTDEMTLFNDVAEKSGVNVVINLGDLTYGSTDNCKKYWENQNKTFLPMLFCIGNHDVNHSKICYSNANNNIKYLNEYVTFSEDHANWYADFGGIRLIGLDSQNGFTTDTVNWLATMLNSCNKKIAVFTHKPCRAGLNWNSASITNASDVLEILNNYEYDVIGYFYGHTHVDNMFKSVNDKFPFINIACALPVKPESSGYPTVGDPVAYDREQGTYSEFCFDVMNIHLSSNKIKMYRFGVGSDRTYTPT